MLLATRVVLLSFLSSFFADLTQAKTTGQRVFIDYSSIHPDLILNPDRSLSGREKSEGPSTGGSDQDCKSGGSTYGEGETWHPEVRPFGKIQCVICTCLRGRISCERTQCPPEESLPCRKPEANRGCCKGCPPSVRYMQRTFLPDQVLSGSPVSAPSPSGTHHALRPCISGSSDTLVYQMFSSQQYTLAFHDVQKKQVQIMTWKLDAGFIGSLEETIETSDKFNQGIYSLIGETRQDRVNRFKKKIDQVMGRCIPGCNKRSVVKHIRKLKLKHVAYKNRC